MGILELFENYIKLNYEDPTDNIVGKDIKVDGTTIIRSGYLGNTIYYMNSGSSLFIPREWFSIFKGLYLNNSKQIIFCEPKTKVEEFIQKMTLLQTRKPDSDYLSILGDICIIGTGEVRKILEKLGIKVGAFEFRSLEKNFEI